MDNMKLFILICSICCCLASNSTLEYGDLPEATYDDATYADSGSLAGLSNMAENFVNIVYPSFAELAVFITAILKSSNQLGYITTNWQELAKLEAGFIACVVFGLLFIVFVPIVGMFMCCCRTCCKNCGGKMKQSTKRSKSAWRQCLCVSLLLLTILMTIPVMFVFVTNAWIGQVVDDVPAKTSQIISNTINYVDNVQNQFDYIVDQYGVLDADLRVKVGDLGTSVGGKAVDIANNLANDSFIQLDILINDVNTVTTNMQAISTAVDDLSAGITALDTELTAQSNKMKTGLNDCSAAVTTDAECFGVYMSVSNLGVPVNSAVLTDMKTSLDDILVKLESYDLQSLRGNVTSEIASISTKVTEQTSEQSNNSLSYLDTAKTEFDNLQGQLPLDQIANYTNQFVSVNNSIYTTMTAYDENYDQYRFIAGAVLGSVLAVIVGCYYIGMIMGSIGYTKREDPSDRKCTSNCGGLWLMSGVGLSFIFSWLLMFLVLLTFTFGGHSTRYICQPISKPYVGLRTLEESIPVFNLSAMLQTPEISLQDLLTGCSNDESLYSVLHLQNQFDLDKLVEDIEKELAGINDTLDDISVDLTGFKIYDSTVQQGLSDVKTSGVASYNFSNAEKELNKNLTNPDLNDLAVNMNISADKYIPAHDDEAELTRQYSYELLVTQTNYVDPLQVHIDNIKSSINNIKSVQSTINQAVDNLDTALQELDTEIQTNAVGLIHEAVAETIKEFTDEISGYLNWLVDQIKRNFGACGPVAAAYDQTIGLFCIYLVDTLNGLWFSLGWCVFLLIPSAIVAMKLTKFFRRMDFSEEYEDAFPVEKY